MTCSSGKTEALGALWEGWELGSPLAALLYLRSAATPTMEVRVFHSPTRECDLNGLLDSELREPHLRMGILVTPAPMGNFVAEWGSMASKAFNAECEGRACDLTMAQWGDAFHTMMLDPDNRRPEHAPFIKCPLCREPIICWSVGPRDELDYSSEDLFTFYNAEGLGDWNQFQVPPWNVRRDGDRVNMTLTISDRVGRSRRAAAKALPNELICAQAPLWITRCARRLNALETFCDVSSVWEKLCLTARTILAGDAEGEDRETQQLCRIVGHIFPRRPRTQGSSPRRRSRSPRDR